MTLRTRLATLVLAAAFAAGPALALASAGDACCCPPAPCHEVQGGCELGLASADCCDETPDAAPAPPAKRSVEPPAAHPAPEHSHASLSARPLCPRAAPDLAARVSPLRLSVVLLI